MLDACFQVKNASIVYIHLIYKGVSEKNTSKIILIWTISVITESGNVSKTAFPFRQFFHIPRAPSAVPLCLAGLTYLWLQVSPRCKWALPSPGMLRSVLWQLDTDVSGQLIGLVLKDQAVFLGSLNLEYGTSQNQQLKRLCTLICLYY